MLFCTLSPSSSPTNKPNATPFIGQPNQSIIISNTYFNPITTEIEIVDQDISTLAIALYGNQTKSLDDGIVGDATWSKFFGEEPKQPQVVKEDVVIPSGGALKIEKLKGHIPDT